MTNELLDRVLPVGTGAKPKPGPSRRRWWIGTLNGCPKRNVVLRGITFSAKTGDTNGVGGRRGALVELTEKQVGELFTAMGNKVARGVGADRGDVYDTRMPSYVRDETDSPLAGSLFMIPEEDAAEIVGAHDWPSAEAPSVLEMLQRGPNQEDWAAPEIQNTSRGDDEVARLRAELARRDEELAELRAELEDEPLDETDKEPPTSAERAKELHKSTVAELEAYASEQGYSLEGVSKKADIVSAIVGAELQAGLIQD